MSIYDHPVHSLDGSDVDLHDYDDKLTLIVNVASKCGLTPQYETLEKIHEQYADRGFTVLGVPCNQFMGQEPGTAEEIQSFCSMTYGVTFPLLEKVDVNGEDRHPLYAELAEVSDSGGHAGDIRWNFEKFLVGPGGRVIGRYAPTTLPDDDEIVGDIEANLPA